MKVKDLIEKLKIFDQELDVVTPYEDGTTWFVVDEDMVSLTKLNQHNDIAHQRKELGGDVNVRYYVSPKWKDKKEEAKLVDVVEIGF